ncbi:ABC transporter ATP-binding protein ['Camptotheca acuminata' phytoplasma]|uniref:ABC transporter ATP-binding protein n=1 Tax='Camptotheca acuminata' phytoplasma TaxID=3239192 RepID=UPI00351A604C
MNDKKVILEVNHVSHIFSNKFQGLKDISFKVHQGEIFGIVGESGSGKTTLGKILSGILKPTSGDIILHQEENKYFIEQGIKKNLKNIKDKKNLKEIQMIFQNPDSALNPRMNCQNLIEEGLIYQGIKTKDIRDEKVKKILSLVGLKEYDLPRYPHEFSGGQKQRIVIARALIIEPKIIIADEPVSALDVSIQAQILNLLNDLKEKLGLTIIFVSHDLSIVKYFCDRLIVMYRGEIVEQGTSENIFKNAIHPYTKQLLKDSLL